MAKIDLKNAFRLVPVRPKDWNPLGIQWQDQFYIDICLPFGLRSAPFLFNQLADAIHWSLQHNHGVRHVLHYLDDFFTAGSPGTKECSDNLQAMLSLCNNTRQMLKALWGKPDLSHIQKNSIVSLLLTYADMQFRWLSTQPHLVY